MSEKASPKFRKEIEKTFKFLSSEAERCKIMWDDIVTHNASKKHAENIDLLFRFGGFGTNGIIVGRAAHKRFNHLCEDILQEFGASSTISVNSFARRLELEIMDTVKPDCASDFIATFEFCVSNVLKKFAEEQETSTHFLPLNIEFVDAPSVFEIGTFKIHKTASLINQLLADLRAEVGVSSEELAWGQNYFSKFPSIIEIFLPKVELELSRIIARKIAEKICDLLTLLIAVDDNRYFRVGGRQPGASVEQSITRRKGKLSTSWLQFTDSTHSVGGIRKLISSPETSQVFRHFDQAVTFGIISEVRSFAAQRIIESISWFGEAVRDHNAKSKIVKFTVCVEFVTLAAISAEKSSRKIGPRIQSEFVARASALAFISGIEPPKPLYLSYSQMYKARSDIVHGRKFSKSRENWRNAKLAEFHARCALLGALSFFGKDDGIADVSLTDLDISAAFDRLVKWHKSAKKKSLFKAPHK